MRSCDGLDLLGIVRERWPDRARVLMSGMLDRLGSRSTSPAAHDVIAKPCDMRALAALIDGLPTERTTAEPSRAERRRWPRAALRVPAVIAHDSASGDAWRNRYPRPGRSSWVHLRCQ